METQGTTLAETLKSHKYAAVSEIKPRKTKEERQITLAWVMFGLFLLLAAGFAYLSIISFILVETSEVGTALFIVTRWVFLAVSAGFLGLSIWKLRRALRRSNRRGVTQ